MEAPQESDNQRQARLRRERRQAKIQAQGTSRLEAITSLSGRPAPAPESTSAAPLKPAPAAPTATTSSATNISAADPPEVDISEHYYEPKPRALPSSGTNTPGTTPFGATDGPAAADDPMMRMMQQMLGGGSGALPGMDNNGNGGNEDPMLKMLQTMMGGGAGGMPGTSQQQDVPPATDSAYIWRIVHAIFSFSLAAYIALASTFNGSKLSRSQSVYGMDGAEGGVGQRLFWIFATAEVGLQSTRFFLEKGRLQQGGLMGTLGSMLPEPYAGYVRLVGRYSVIYTTVVADAMVVVFVLGVMAWWKGLIVS